jgi:hypothetical protein
MRTHSLAVRPQICFGGARLSLYPTRSHQRAIHGGISDPHYGWNLKWIGGVVSTVAFALTAMVVPTTKSHHAENVGASDCQAVIVERKFLPGVLQRGLGLVERQPELGHHPLGPRQCLGRT